MNVEIELLPDAEHAPAGRRLEAGVVQPDRPVLVPAPLHLHRAASQLDRHVAGQRRVLREVAFDHLALVAERDHEVAEAVVGIDLHDVPENRVGPDLDHRLGLLNSLFGQPASRPAGKNHSPHTAPNP